MDSDYVVSRTPFQAYDEDVNSSFISMNQNTSAELLYSKNSRATPVSYPTLTDSWADKNISSGRINGAPEARSQDSRSYTPDALLQMERRLRFLEQNMQTLLSAKKEDISQEEEEYEEQPIESFLDEEDEENLSNLKLSESSENILEQMAAPTKATPGRWKDMIKGSNNDPYSPGFR